MGDSDAWWNPGWETAFAMIGYLWGLCVGYLVFG